MATKEIIKTEPDNESQVVNFIEQAISKNLPVETMERLFALHKEVKADRAKQLFVNALAEFQKAVPVIKKTKKVMAKDGRNVRYMYAPIDSIVEQIKGALATNKLSYSWDTESKDKMMKVVCKLTHEAGHVEMSSFEVPIGSEFMTMPQQYAAALTFARRYTLCNVLGVSTADEDTDATTVTGAPERTVKSPKSRIVFLLRELEVKGNTVESIKHLTGLEATEQNSTEIISRLEVLLREKNESTKVR